MSKEKMLKNISLWNRQKHLLEDLYDSLDNLETSMKEQDKKLFEKTAIQIRHTLRKIKKHENF